MRRPSSRVEGHCQNLHRPSTPVEGVRRKVRRPFSRVEGHCKNYVDLPHPWKVSAEKCDGLSHVWRVTVKIDIDLPHPWKASAEKCDRFFAGEYSSPMNRGASIFPGNCSGHEKLSFLRKTDRYSK